MLYSTDQFEIIIQLCVGVLFVFVSTHKVLQKLNIGNRVSVDPNCRFTAGTIPQLTVKSYVYTACATGILVLPLTKKQSKLASGILLSLSMLYVHVCKLGTCATHGSWSPTH